MNISKIKLTPDFLILSAAFIVLILIRIIFDFNGLYGQDSYEYLRYSRRLTELLTTGMPPGDYFWPVNFPLLGAILSLVIRDNIFALQLISMLSFILTAFYTLWLIQLIYPNAGKVADLYLLLFLILSPLLFQSAFLVMSDMLAVFFTTAAIFHVLKFRHKNNRTDFFLAIFFSVSAIMTRYAAAVVLLIPGILLITTFFKRFRFADLVLGLLIAALCLSPHLLIKGRNSAKFLGHQWLQSWSVKNWFLSEFSTSDGFQKYRLPNLLYGLSDFYYPGFFFMGIVFVFLMQKKIFYRLEYLILYVPAMLYALFLAGIPFQNMRFLLLTFPFVVVSMFLPFQRFRHKVLSKNIYLWSFTGLVILIQTALIYKYSSGIYRTNRAEKNIAKTVLSYPNRPIYTFGIDGALKYYGVDSGDIVSMWYSKLDSARVSALVLFNEDKFKQQWKDRNPMINWQMIRKNYRLEQIESLPAGWELFQIEGRKD
jgi:4-amino-4-deoxy-L-arabinose transferase-like glycosyltransferase